jgi:hypothetical protein
VTLDDASQKQTFLPSLAEQLIDARDEAAAIAISNEEVSGGSPATSVAASGGGAATNAPTEAPLLCVDYLDEMLVERLAMPFPATGDGCRFSCRF